MNMHFGESDMYGCVKNTRFGDKLRENNRTQLLETTTTTMHAESVVVDIHTQLIFSGQRIAPNRSPNQLHPKIPR